MKTATEAESIAILCSSPLALSSILLLPLFFPSLLPFFFHHDISNQRGARTWHDLAQGLVDEREQGGAKFSWTVPGVG